MLTLLLKSRNFNFRQSLKVRKILRNNVGHYIVIQGSICYECIIILKVYALKTRKSKCIKQKN